VERRFHRRGRSSKPGRQEARTCRCIIRRAVDVHMSQHVLLREGVIGHDLIVWHTERTQFPEAFANGGPWVAMATACGFALAFLLSHATG